MSGPDPFIDPAEHRDRQAAAADSRGPHILFLIGRDGCCRQINEAAISRLELDADTIRGLSFCSLVHPDDREAVTTALTTLNDGRDIPVDFRLNSASIGLVRLIGECTRLGSDHGDMSLIVGYPAGELEESSGPAAITADERSLREILDNTTTVVYAKDLLGRYLFVNSEFERLFGVARDTVRGQTDFDIFPTEMAEAFRANDEYVAWTGKVLKIDEVAPHEDGPHTYVSVKFPLRNEQGEIHALAGISTDITDRVRAEQTAEALRTRLELILRSVNDGIIGLDDQGEVTFANLAAEKLLQAEGAGLKPFLPSIAVDVAIRSDTFDESPTTGTETRLKRSDGSTVPVEYEVQPVVENGRHWGAVITLRDVSDRRRREAIEREMQSAQVVQQILYPQAAPTCPGFDIAGHVYSAESMCGDYLDFIPGDDGSLTIAVGDVSGHGFGPALQMVETRACLRAMLRTGTPLDSAITQLNAILLDDTPQDSFISLIVAQVNPATRTFRYVSAGHPGWLLREADAPRLLTSEDLVLGIVRAQHFTVSQDIPLRTGDVLFLPTDGVQETRDARNELFSVDRMLQTVVAHRSSSARDMVERLYRDTLDFAGPQPQQDDVTIAIAKVV